MEPPERRVPQAPPARALQHPLPPQVLQHMKAVQADQERERQRRLEVERGTCRPSSSPLPVLPQLLTAVWQELGSMEGHAEQQGAVWWCTASSLADASVSSPGLSAELQSPAACQEG